MSDINLMYGRPIKVSQQAESVRETINHLRTIANNIEHELQWLPPYFSDAHIKALRHAAELLSRSAGVWVPVGEGLPKDWLPVACINDGELDIQVVYAGKWVDVEGTITHWLDVRLPGPNPPPA